MACAAAWPQSCATISRASKRCWTANTNGRTKQVPSFRNPARTLLERMKRHAATFGDPGNRIGYWSPAIITDSGDMNLTTDEGLALFSEWLAIGPKPDIVVIDTVRNAFSGMDEHSSQQWMMVNRVAKRIRNGLDANVILVHHRNKPQEGGMGREAGSTAQLTDIDTQVFVTQVYEQKMQARAKAGVFNEEIAVHDITGTPWTPFEYLKRMLEPGSYLRMVQQISYGKVRSETELHETHYIGWAERVSDGSSYIVSTKSKKQKARYFHFAGKPAGEIAQDLMVPTSIVNKWVGLS